MSNEKKNDTVNLDELCGDDTLNTAEGGCDSDFAGRLEAEIMEIMGKSPMSEEFKADASQKEEKKAAPVVDEEDIFTSAVRIAVERGEISSSYLQRSLVIGYGRAAWIMSAMEELGYITPWGGGKPCKVLLSAEEYEKKVADGTLLGDAEQE